MKITSEEIKRRQAKVEAARLERLESAACKDLLRSTRETVASAKKADARKYSRMIYLVEKYGVTQEWYQAEYAKQGGLCAICKVHFDDLRVDHCHLTGRVRGLLCDKCNMGLGHFRDDIELLASASGYLENSFIELVTL